MGAVFGGLLAWAVTVGRRDGLLRRVVVAASGTLAQFGGVMLAFAFLATFGFNGLVTVFLHDQLGLDTFAWGGWLYELPGLAVVYTYFQIPLMVIVFLPAIEGLQAPVAGGVREPGRHRLDLLDPRRPLPILWPSFLGGTLLLFANAFSAYATAKALISQASPLVPLQIGTFLTSEVVLGQAEPRQGAGARHDRDRGRHHGALRHPADADLAMAALRKRRGEAALRWGVLLLGRRLPAAAALRHARVLDPRGRRRADARLLARDRQRPRPRGRHHAVARAGGAHRAADARAARADDGLGPAPACRRCAARSSSSACCRSPSRPSSWSSAWPRSTAWVAYFFGESPLTLTFVYTVLVLPFAYRAIAAGLSAIDLVTLAEAGRSLGCSWAGVIWRIVVPNIRAALISASLLSVALVLGEFTISSLLSFDTLQVVINLLGKRDAGIAVAVSLAALILVFVLLFLLSYVGRANPASHAAEEG